MEKRRSIKNKKKIAMILSLVSILLVAGTMALLSAITGEKVNAFSGGHVNVSVIETGGSKDNTDLENPGNSDNNTNSYTGNINEGVTKTVAIKNLDKETYHTVDTYVRVRLVPSFRYNEGSEYAGQLVPVNVNADNVTYSGMEGGWMVKKTTMADGTSENYFYYKEAIAPGENTTQLMTAVKYTGAVPENAHFELQVLTEGVAADQKNTEGKGALEAAWGITAADFNTADVNPAPQSMDTPAEETPAEAEPSTVSTPETQDVDS